MTNGSTDPEKTRPDNVGTLKYLANLVFGEDRSLGLVLAVGLILVFTTLAVIQSGAALADFPDAMRTIGIGSGIAAIAVVIFRVVAHGLLSTIIVWFVALIGMAVTLCFAVQFATGDRFTPPLAKAGCYIAPASKGCPFSADYSEGDIETAQTTTLAEAGRETASALQPQRTGPVFIQFAGAIARDDMSRAARALQEAGWRVEGASRRGERIGTAAGLNEVRYFHAEDSQDAELLAREFAEKPAGCRPTGSCCAT